MLPGLGEIRPAPEDLPATSAMASVHRAASGIPLRYAVGLGGMGR
jgi:hypothetical protein